MKSARFDNLNISQRFTRVAENPEGWLEKIEPTPRRVKGGFVNAIKVDPPTGICEFIPGDEIVWYE